jgi:hypothetical protein
MLNIFRPFCLFFTIGFTLAACSGGGGSGVTNSVPAAPQYTMSTLPAGTALTLTPHQGLEAVSLFTPGLIVTNPVATYTKTAIGFDLVRNPGETAWSFDTRAGSSQDVGPQHYRIFPGPQGGMMVSRSSADVFLTAGEASNLEYATYGRWLYKSTPLTGFDDMGVFATGIPTTMAQMPTSGSASYTGKVTGAVVFSTQPSVTFAGNIALNADFAANAISGQATNLQTSALPFAYDEPVVTGRMNDIALTGGTITGTTFSGTATAAAAQAGVTTYDIHGVTGQFGGKFYGPHAAELAGSLSMSGTIPGATQPTVIGAFGARK